MKVSTAFLLRQRSHYAVSSRNLWVSVSSKIATKTKRCTKNGPVNWLSAH
jgi:hypothetical protein